MTLSVQDIREIVESTDIKQFKEKIDKYPNLLKEDLGYLVVELFAQGKTDFFACLLEKILDRSIVVGDNNEPMLIYLAKNEQIEKRHEFIDILLNNERFKTNNVVNERSSEGSALHVAIRLGDNALFKKLINYKDTDLGLSYQDVEAPLVCAIKHGRIEYAHALLGKNIKIADIDTFSFLAVLFDYEKVLTLKKNDLAHTYEGRERRWQELINKTLPMLNLKLSTYNDASFSISHQFFLFVLKKTDPLSLQNIFKFCKFDINASIDAGKSTMVIEATKQDNVELLKILKAKEADFNTIDCHEFTAAHYLESVAAAEIVLTPENTDYIGKGIYPPLLKAISDKRDINLINYLVGKSTVFECSSNNILHLLPNISDILSNSGFPRNSEPHEERLTDFVDNLFKRMSDLGIDIQPLLKQIWPFDSFYQSWQGNSPLEISCIGDHLALFKILLKKEKESAKEIQSLRDNKILLRALIWDAKEIVDYILSQGVESGNYVSLEVLKYAVEKLKAENSSPDNTRRLKILDEVISKFTLSEQSDKVPQSLANNSSPAATQTKIGTDTPIIVTTPSPDPFGTGEPKTPVNVGKAEAAQQLIPNQLQSSNSLLQPAEKQKSDNVSTNAPQDNPKQNADSKVLENNSQPQVVPKPSSSEPKNHSNQSDIRVAHDNELKQSQDEEKNKHSDANSNLPKTNKSEIFIVRWLKTFVAWAGEMIDRICNFFTGNTSKNTSNKIIKGEKGKEIGSAPPTTPNKNQKNEQNIS